MYRILRLPGSEKCAPALRQTSTTLWEKYAEAARTMICAVMPIARTVASALRSRLAAPLPETAQPLAAPSRPAGRRRSRC